MKLKVYVTKIHSVEALRNGVIVMHCDPIEDKASKDKDRIIFLNKKTYKMIKRRGYFYLRSGLL